MYGSVKGTGAQLDVTTVGFRPKEVQLYNQAGDQAHWQESMPDDAMHKVTAAGAGSYVTTNGITPLANGFRLEADGDLNVADEVLHWLAKE
jgi:hypothetical protein